jgi:hypothetical protein
MSNEETQETHDGDDAADIQRLILAEMQETNRLKRLELGTASDDPTAKLLAADKLAHEETLALGEACGPEQRIPLIVRHSAPDFGPLTIQVSAVAFRATDCRRGDRPDAIGRLRVQSLRDWDTIEATETIRAHHMEANRSSLEQLQREGLKNELAQLEQDLERRNVRADVWKQITLPTFRLLVGRLIDDLVATGAVSLVDAAAAAQ